MVFNEDKFDHHLISITEVLAQCYNVGFAEANVHVYSFEIPSAEEVVNLSVNPNDPATALHSTLQMLTLTQNYQLVQKMIWKDVWPLFFRVVGEFREQKRLARAMYCQIGHPLQQEFKQRQLTKSVDSTIPNTKKSPQKPSLYFDPTSHPELDDDLLIKAYQLYFPANPPANWPMQQYLFRLYSMFMSKFLSSGQYAVNLAKPDFNPMAAITSGVHWTYPFTSPDSQHLFRAMAFNQHLLIPASKPMSLNNYTSTSIDQLTHPTPSQLFSPQHLSTISLLQSPFLPKLPPKFVLPINPIPTQFSTHYISGASIHSNNYLPRQYCLPPLPNTISINNPLTLSNHPFDPKTDPISILSDIDISPHNPVYSARLDSEVKFAEPGVFPTVLHFDSIILIDNQLLCNYKPTEIQLRAMHSAEESSNNTDGNNKNRVFWKHHQVHPQTDALAVSNQFTNPPTEPDPLSRSPQTQTPIFSIASFKTTLENSYQSLNFLGRNSTQPPKGGVPDGLCISSHRSVTVDSFPMHQISTNLLHKPVPTDPDSHSDETLKVIVTHLFRHDGILMQHARLQTSQIQPQFHHDAQFTGLAATLAPFATLQFLFGIRIIPYQFNRSIDDLNISTKYATVLPFNDINAVPPKHIPSNLYESSSSNSINIAIPYLHNPLPIHHSTPDGKCYFPGSPHGSFVVEQCGYPSSPFVTVNNQTHLCSQFNCPMTAIILVTNPIIDNTAPQHPIESTHQIDPITRPEFNYLRERMSHEYKQQLIDNCFASSFRPKEELDALWKVYVITPQEWTELFRAIKTEAIAIRLKILADAISR